VCESNPRINVNSTTYSAADGMKYTVLDVRQRERHGNSTGKVERSFKCKSADDIRNLRNHA